MPKWKCPKCGRTFAVKIPKEHSCVKISAEKHFEGKPLVLKKVYDKLEREVSNFGNVSIQPIKGGIFFKKAGTFAMINIRKDHLKIEFFLDHKHDAFPVEKIFQYTQKKIVHVVSVSEMKEVDRQLINWLKISYGMAK